MKSIKGKPIIRRWRVFDGDQQIAVCTQPHYALLIVAGFTDTGRPMTIKLGRKTVWIQGERIPKGEDYSWAANECYQRAGIL